MTTIIKILTLAAKIFGVVVMIDWTTFSPKWGVAIFMIASIAKDTINRIGDYLDDKLLNNSFKTS